MRGAHAAETVRWVSPRGTVEVLDDYPYWVAKKFGYFGDIETTLEPGPSDATATVKLVDQNQADGRRSHGQPEHRVHANNPFKKRITAAHDRR